MDTRASIYGVTRKLDSQMQTTTPIFRWSGPYIGFVSDGSFFDSGGAYLGWQDKQDRMWSKDGNYLGDIIDDHYVMRRDGCPSPVRQPPRIPPVYPELPVAPTNRSARPNMPGWSDALEKVGIVPEEEDLLGTWEVSDDLLVLTTQGYEITQQGEVQQQGLWMLRGNLMLRPDVQAGAEQIHHVYSIMEYGNRVHDATGGSQWTRPACQSCSDAAAKPERRRNSSPILAGARVEIHRGVNALRLRQKF